MEHVRTLNHCSPISVLITQIAIRADENILAGFFARRSAFKNGAFFFVAEIFISNRNNSGAISNERPFEVASCGFSYLPVSVEIEFCPVLLNNLLAAVA